MARHDGREPNQHRPISVTRNYTRKAPGSVLIEMGDTRVLCTASLEAGVPDFLLGKGSGWMTAEYAMLPGSTAPRKRRERAGTKPDGRGVEIQRLIGRSLRNVVDLRALGEHTLWLDCDVLDADGGTRTASITGAFVAAVDAVLRAPDDAGIDPAKVFVDSVAAISVGILGGTVLLDLDYVEDSRADVDMNLVMTGKGEFIEIQGTGERTSFSAPDLEAMLTVGQEGIARMRASQRDALGAAWPLSD